MALVKGSGRGCDVIMSVAGQVALAMTDAQGHVIQDTQAVGTDDDRAIAITQHEIYQMRILT